MTTNPDQTQAPVVRPRGRPPLSETAKPSRAEFFGKRIPPIRCPCCGRHQQPKQDTKQKINAKGEITCSCSLCGGRFAWLIPTVRPILPKNG